MLAETEEYLYSRITGPTASTLTVDNIEVLVTEDDAPDPNDPGWTQPETYTFTEAVNLEDESYGTAAVLAGPFTRGASYNVFTRIIGIPPESPVMRTGSFRPE